MEYLRDRGPAADVPVADIISTFAREYPGFGREQAKAAATQFRDEATRAARSKAR